VASAHLGIRSFECDTCYATFSTKQNRNIHQFRHRRTQLYPLPPPNTRLEGTISSIPKLTMLLLASTDPTLRPYCRLERIFAYPATQDRPVLPKLDGLKVVQGQLGRI